MDSASPPPPIKLVSPGPRDFIDAAKAQGFIDAWTAQIIEHRASHGISSDDVVLCDRVSLSDKSYDIEAATSIASFFREPFVHDSIGEGRALPPLARGIVEADLSDCIAGRVTEIGLEVLKTLCDAFAEAKLVDVNLSDNAIGDQGIGPCKSVLSMKTLERVALCNNGLSENTMREVVDLLVSDEDGTGCTAGRLTKIHFYNNMSGDGGCKEFVRLLEQSRKLVDLRFSSTRVSKGGSDVLASALDASLAEGHNPDLKRLDLCDNRFTNKASYEALFRAIGTTKCLTHLNLAECDMEDDGVKKICHALFECDSALESLDLSGNGIEKAGAKHVADYIRDCGGELKELHLEDNELTSKGVVSIAAAFHGSEDGHSVEVIKLNTCLIGAIGARALIDAYGPEGKDLPNLKKLYLNGNSFAEDVMGELEVAFDDILGDMEDNDSDGDADDDLSDDDDEEEAEEDADEGPVDDAVDDLADAMGKSLVV